MAETCPECGRTNNGFFDHIDADCLGWPDPSKDGDEQIEHRGYVITVCAPHMWRITPAREPDNWLAQVGPTIEAAYRDIDRREG